jgi:hypothetical protein
VVGAVRLARIAPKPENLKLATESTCADPGAWGAITLRPSANPRKGTEHGRGPHAAWHREGDGVIVVGRFKGDPYDGVQLSYDAGRRNLYLTPEGALRLALLLAAAGERDIDIR